MNLFDTLSNLGYGELHFGHDARLGPARARRHPLDAARAGHRRHAHPLLRDRSRRHRRRDPPGAGHGLQGRHRATCRTAAARPSSWRRADLAKWPAEQARRALPRLRPLRRPPRRPLRHHRGLGHRRRPTWTSCAPTTKHVLGTSIDKGGSGDPSPFTALGCRRGIEAVANHVFGKPDLKGLHVAVQGVGHVGAHLARELHAGRRAPHHLRRRSGAPPGDRHRARRRRRRRRRTSSRSSATSSAPCALGGALTEALVPQAQVQGRRRRGQQPAAHARRRQGAAWRAASSTRPTTPSTAAASSTSPRSSPATTRPTRARRRSPSTTPSPTSSSARKREKAQPEVITDRIAEERIAAGHATT